MKYVNVFLFFVIACSAAVSQSQNFPSALHFEHFDWSTIEYDYDLDYKQVEVNQLFVNDEIREKYAYAEMNTADFHLIDYDEDGYQDLIYDGYLADENCRHTIFFRGYCKDWCGYFQLEKDFYGEVIGMWRYQDGNPVTFKIIDRPMCDGQTTHVETYEVLNKNEPLGFRLVRRDAFILWTAFPEKFDKRITFRVKQDFYSLRSEPKIDNTTTVELDAETTVEGNVVAEYPKGSTGVALASKIDKEGIEWWFVLMDPYVLPESSLFTEGNNAPAPTACYGWMSSRHLEVTLEHFN